MYSNIQRANQNIMLRRCYRTSSGSLETTVGNNSTCKMVRGQEEGEYQETVGSYPPRKQVSSDIAACAT